MAVRVEVDRAPPRVQLSRLVAATPGITIQQATRFLGVTWKACAHHVRVLARANQLRIVKSGRTVCLFAPNHLPADLPKKDVDLLCLLLVDGSYRDFLEIVDQEPGLSQSDMARRFGLSPPAVSRRVRVLVRLGALERRRGPAQARLFSTGRTRHFLEWTNRRPHSPDFW